MTSKAKELRGCQEPRLLTGPKFASSAGDEAIKLANMAGLHLDPWQELVLQAMLREDEIGDWAAYEFGLLVARQNGKGAILEARALWGLFLGGEKHILWSAHEFKTAKEHYLRVKNLIEGCPSLLKRIKKRGNRVVGFRQSNDDTSIILENGARLRFMARSTSTGRGFSAQVLILDEAQILSSATVDSLMPTQSAMANPQIIYTGTVPGPKDDGEHFTLIRDRGRSGTDDQLCWMEWSTGDDREEPPDLDSVENWLLCNPGIGYRLSLKFTEKERNTLTDEGFERERLSFWPSEGSGQRWGVVTQAEWENVKCSPVDPETWMLNPITYAIEVAPDFSWASVAAAGECRDGGEAVELVAHHQGTGWLVGVVSRLIQENRPRHLVIDSGSPAAAFIEPLRAAGVENILEARTADVVLATGSYYIGITHRQVWHLDGEDQAPLEYSVSAATKKKVRDSWVWLLQDEGTATPIRAVTLALWGSRRPVESEARSAYEVDDLTVV